MPNRESLVVVAFEEFERVTHGGITRTTYCVLVDGIWQPVGKVPSAVSRSVAPPPGIIWMRIVELRLGIGTAVERVVELPRRDHNLDTAAVLFGRARGQMQQVRRQRLRVARSGRLAPIAST